MFPNPNEYQVQNNDKDLMELAARTNTPYQTLKNLNPYINSISQGQVINVPSGFGQTTPLDIGQKQPLDLNTLAPKPGGAPFMTAFQAQQSGYASPGIVPNQYRPVQPGAFPNQTQAMLTPGNKPPTQNKNAPIYSGMQAAPMALLQQLTNAQSADDLPDVVSLADFKKTGMTLEQAFAAGYKLENGMLTLNPAGTAGQQTQQNGTPEQNFAANMAAQKELMEKYRYYKGKYVKIKDLVRQGRLDLRTGREYDQPMRRNRHGRLVRADRPQAETPQSPLETVRPDTPSVTLDLILGS